MNQKKVVVLDADTLPGRTFHFDFPHELAVYGTTDAAETAGRVRDAHIIITNKVMISADIIARSAT